MNVKLRLTFGKIEFGTVIARLVVKEINNY